MIRVGPLSLMANYSGIQKIALSRCCLVVAVGGKRRVEEGEVNHRRRRKDREIGKRNSKEVR